MRLSTLSTAVAVVMACASNPAAAQVRSFNLEEQPAITGIPEFGRQAGIQIVAPASGLSGKRTHAVKGEMPIDAALKLLLEGTGLRVGARSDSTISLVMDPVTSDATTAPILDVVVVTGTADRQDKFSAPYSVSVVGRRQIDDNAPHSVADMLKAVPGITVEASGGAGGSENVVIRGLPWAGWRLIDFQQDGMPLFESNTERFMNIDQLYRLDIDTQRAEIVRGGTAPLFANNASGGVVNFITNHGTERPQGEVRVETGTGGRLRGDGYWSGPVSGNLLGSVSGFYRQSDGLRDPGFANGDHGGQVKLGLTYKLERGEIFGDIKYLNDHGIFYTAVPLTDPRDGSSLSGLLDPTSGTLDTNAFRHVTLRTRDGSGMPITVERDLREGIHPDLVTATLGGKYDFGAGLQLSNTYRHSEGTLDFQAIFNGASPSDAAAFLAGQLAAARNAFGSNVSSLRYVLAGTDTIYSPETTEGLVMANSWNSIHTRLRFDANDLRLNKSLETSLGRHQLTAGVYYSDYSYDHAELLNAILMNVRDNPDALDIQALSANGQVLGAVTERGFISYGGGSQNGSLTGDAVAFYLADNWHLTPAWSIDAGVRKVERKQDGVQGVLGTVVADPNGPVAARNVQGVVRFLPRSEELRGTSWTVGSGLDWSDQLNVFGRYSKSFSFPRFDTVLSGATLPGTTTPLPVADVQQAEGGVRFATRGIELSAVGFWSKFERLNGGTQVADVNGAITTSNILFDTRTLGLEIEGIVRFGSGFEITASGMLQDPETVSVQTLTGLDAQSARGGEIPRTPKYQFTLTPAYEFSIDAMDARVFASFYTVGRRFQDYSNLSRLPAYSTFDLGLSVATQDGIELRALVQNVTDEVGLTEGNARASVLGTGTVGDATVGRPIFGRNFTLALGKKWR